MRTSLSGVILGLTFLIAAAAALRLALARFEYSVLYHPDQEVLSNPRQSLSLPYEEVWLTAEDGTRLNAWFVPGKRPATILLLHGNAGNISHRMDKLEILHRLGYSIFMPDYRGYGKSLGRPSEAGIYLDAQAAYQYLLGVRRLRLSQIILYGESLGCAPALHLAAQVPAGALILEAPFTSVPDMAKLLLPFLPANRLVRQRYDNKNKIGITKLPILILHSPEDEIIPFKMGEELYRLARPPKELIRLRGDHNAGFMVSGGAYPKAIADFLKRHLR